MVIKQSVKLYKSLFIKLNTNYCKTDFYPKCKLYMETFNQNLGELASRDGYKFSAGFFLMNDTKQAAEVIVTMAYLCYNT